MSDDTIVTPAVINGIDPQTLKAFVVRAMRLQHAVTRNIYDRSQERDTEGAVKVNGVDADLQRKAWNDLVEVLPHPYRVVLLNGCSPII